LLRQSKVLLSKPEMVIAIALRGEADSGTDRKARPRRPARQRTPRKQTMVCADT
jgi:hypothetical protein